MKEDLYYCLETLAAAARSAGIGPREATVFGLMAAAALAAYAHRRRRRCPWVAWWQIALDAATILGSPVATFALWSSFTGIGAPRDAITLGSSIFFGCWFCAWVRDAAFTEREETTVIMDCQSDGKWETDAWCRCMSPTGVSTHVSVPIGYAEPGATIAVRYQLSLVTGRVATVCLFLRQLNRGEPAWRST